MYTATSSTLGAVAATTAATAAGVTQLGGTSEVAGTTAGTAFQGATTGAAALAQGPRPSGAGAAVASAAQTLPFTGVNIFFLVLTAITMLLMGLAMIRIGRTLATREPAV